MQMMKNGRDLSIEQSAAKDAGRTETFVKLRRSLLTSAAWTMMSVNCFRLMNFLMAEHLSKGGKENGNLRATYDQLVERGIPRRLVHRTIDEAEALGLIRAVRGGRRGFTNHMTDYTITYLPCRRGNYWADPTDDWISILPAQIAEFQKLRKMKTKKL